MKNHLKINSKYIQDINAEVQNINLLGNIGINL